MLKLSDGFHSVQVSTLSLTYIHVYIVHPESSRTKRQRPNAFKLATHPRVKRVLRLRLRASAHGMYQYACTRT